MEIVYFNMYFIITKACLQKLFDEHYIICVNNGTDSAFWFYWYKYMRVVRKGEKIMLYVWFQKNTVFIYGTKYDLPKYIFKNWNIYF